MSDLSMKWDLKIPNIRVLQQELLLEARSDQQLKSFDMSMWFNFDGSPSDEALTENTCKTSACLAGTAFWIGAKRLSFIPGSVARAISDHGFETIMDEIIQDSKVGKHLKSLMDEENIGWTHREMKEYLETYDREKMTHSGVCYKLQEIAESRSFYQLYGAAFIGLGSTVMHGNELRFHPDHSMVDELFLMESMNEYAGFEMDEVTPATGAAMLQDLIDFCKVGSPDVTWESYYLVDDFQLKEPMYSDQRLIERVSDELLSDGYDPWVEPGTIFQKVYA